MVIFQFSRLVTYQIAQSGQVQGFYLIELTVVLVLYVQILMIGMVYRLKFIEAGVMRFRSSQIDMFCRSQSAACTKELCQWVYDAVNGFLFTVTMVYKLSFSRAYTTTVLSLYFKHNLSSSLSLSFAVELKPFFNLYMARQENRFQSNSGICRQILIHCICILPFKCTQFNVFVLFQLPKFFLRHQSSQIHCAEGGL